MVHNAHVQFRFAGFITWQQGFFNFFTSQIIRKMHTCSQAMLNIYQLCVYIRRYRKVLRLTYQMTKQTFWGKILLDRSRMFQHLFHTSGGIRNFDEFRKTFHVLLYFGHLEHLLTETSKWPTLKFVCPKECLPNSLMKHFEGLGNDLLSYMQKYHAGTLFQFVSISKLCIIIDHK